MPLLFAVGRGPAIHLGMVTAVVWAMFSAARVVYAKSRSPYIRFMFHIHNLRMFLAAVSRLRGNGCMYLCDVTALPRAPERGTHSVIDLH